MTSPMTKAEMAGITHYGEIQLGQRQELRKCSGIAGEQNLSDSQVPTCLACMILVVELH